MGKMLEIQSDKPVNVYLAEPSGEAKGGIIVIHEVWGLDNHIKSVADRYAAEGYIALAPSFFELDELSSDEIAQLKTDLFDEVKRVAIQPNLENLWRRCRLPSSGR